MDDFRKRLITALIFGPLIISCFHFLPLFPFFIFIAFVSFFAVLEGIRMSEPRMKYLIVFFSIFSLVFLYFRRYESFLLWLLFSTGLLVTFYVFRIGIGGFASPSELLKAIVVNALIILFVVFPLYYIYALKELNSTYPLVLLLGVWASDVSAYIIGKAFGRHKLCPYISPGKTFEGLAGAFFGSILIFLVLKGIVGFEPLEALLVGFFVGFLGQAGDVLESTVKRYFGLKDSSSIFPGHGGILDRIDSFIFTAPFLYKILSL